MDHLMSPAPRLKMSEYRVPLHLQEEIIKRLPVKLLVQFRSVSKAWKSLIDSPEFITAHTLFNHTPPQHMLVSSEDKRGETNYVGYIDDHTFPQQRYRPTLPPSVKQLRLLRVAGTSHGLLCLHGYYPNFTAKSKSAVIWNPSIRKSIVVPMPYHLFVGFGVCPVTLDPKIVSVVQYPSYESETETKVEVYTLSSGKWRSLITNLPTKPLRISSPKAVTNGSIIYWRAGTLTHNMIMSFDVTHESCEGIDLPDSLARLDYANLFICKLRESLAVVENSGRNMSTVWIMEDGVQRSFTKLFNIMTPQERIVGFRKDGGRLMQSKDGTKLVAYEPNSQNNTVLEISESYCTFYVNSYMETLILLGQSNCSSH